MEDEWDYCKNRGLYDIPFKKTAGISLRWLPRFKSHNQNALPLLAVRVLKA